MLSRTSETFKLARFHTTCFVVYIVDYHLYKRTAALVITAFHKKIDFFVTRLHVPFVLSPAAGKMGDGRGRGRVVVIRCFIYICIYIAANSQLLHFEGADSAITYYQDITSLTVDVTCAEKCYHGRG